MTSPLKTRSLSLTVLKATLNVGADATANTGSTYVNNYYPFWSMAVGQRVVVRFLPDLNEENPHHFMVDKVQHHLVINGQERKIPCLSMYGEDCPICKISQAYYKVKDEINGKKYWKKRQTLAQAIIIEDPLPADPETGETHLGKVRVLTMGYQLLNIIKEGLADPDLEGHPADVTIGCDFVIKKTEQGKYASYAVGTKFTNKVRALTNAELAVAEAGMVDLATLLPKHPGVDKVQAMLDAEMNGETYEDEKSNWNAPSTSTKPAPAAPQAAITADAPWNDSPATTSDSGENPEVEDMLATIRARRKQAASE
jgi:hypothetical protein